MEKIKSKYDYWVYEEEITDTIDFLKNAYDIVKNVYDELKKSTNPLKKANLGDAYLEEFNSFAEFVGDISKFKNIYSNINYILNSFTNETDYYKLDSVLNSNENDLSTAVEGLATIIEFSQDSLTPGMTLTLVDKVIETLAIGTDLVMSVTPNSKNALKNYYNFSDPIIDIIYGVGKENKANMIREKDDEYEDFLSELDDQYRLWVSKIENGTPIKIAGTIKEIREAQEFIATCLMDENEILERLITYEGELVEEDFRSPIENNSDDTVFEEDGEEKDIWSKILGFIINLRKDEYEGRSSSEIQQDRIKVEESIRKHERGITTFTGIDELLDELLIDAEEIFFKKLDNIAFIEDVGLFGDAADSFMETADGFAMNLEFYNKMAASFGEHIGDFMYVFADIENQARLFRYYVDNVAAGNTYMGDNTFVDNKTGKTVKAPEAPKKPSKTTSGSNNVLQEIVSPKSFSSFKNNLSLSEPLVNLPEAKGFTKIVSWIDNNIIEPVKNLFGYAAGTADAENVFLAGEEGPEIIVGAEGYRVFSAGATTEIIENAYRNALDAEDNKAYESGDFENLRTNGGGEVGLESKFINSLVNKNAHNSTSSPMEIKKTVNVYVHHDGEVFLDNAAFNEKLREEFKPMFIRLIEEEEFEQGDGSYKF